MHPYEPATEDDPADKTPPVRLATAPLGAAGRSRSNPLDEIANDLAIWIDQISTEVALAFAPTRAPFSANVSEGQKIAYYRAKLFNPDGTPNEQGRQEEIQRMGMEGFGLVYRAVIKAYPELKIPTPEEISVPQQWPQGGPPMPPGAPPRPPIGPPSMPGGALPGSPRPPIGAPPQPAMMPPGR